MRCGAAQRAAGLSPNFYGGARGGGD